MMKKAIKLLVLAGALLSVGALAANKTTTFKFSYPEYFYFTTNLASETFDFTASDPGTNPGTATSGYGVATTGNLNTCLDDFITNNLSSVTAQDSAGSNTINDSCDFVATDTNTSGFNVDWASTGETAEGAILVATNKSSWAVAAKITTVFSQVDSYVNLQLRTGNSAFTNLSNSSATNIGSLSNGSLDNAWYTNYANIYVVPLQYKLVLTNPLAIPAISSSSADTAIVTYEAASP